mgnify:CR=1 FL=1
MLIKKLTNCCGCGNCCEWKRIVSHIWSIGYLLRASGAHYRKATHLMSKKRQQASSAWVGESVWGSPIVSLAPPGVNWKRSNDARLSVTIGAGDAMKSYPNINEIERWNPV